MGASSGPVPGSGVSAWPGVEEHHKGGSWGYGSGLVGLHRKGKLKGELFAVSENQLALGGAFPPELARPQDVKETKVQNKKT